MRQIQQEYLGYFNVRPVTDPKYMLSYVMPNYKVFKHNSEAQKPIRVMHYDRAVHLNGITIHIKSFPFFSRDRIVTVCAHAVLLMVSRYFRRHLGLTKLTIPKVLSNTSYDRLDVFPSEGIEKNQMISILNENDILTKSYVGSTGIRQADDMFDRVMLSSKTIGELVFAYIDSRFPVVLVIGNHAVVVNGSTYFQPPLDPNDPRELVIYDDSGAFFEPIQKLRDKTWDDREPPPPPFLWTATWEEIETIADGVSDGFISIIVPHYKRISKEFYQLRIDLEREGVFAEGLAGWRRIFLVEFSMLKEFIVNESDVPLYQHYDLIEKDGSVDAAHIIPFSQQYMLSRLADRILKTDSSRYYWCLEIPKQSKDETLYYNYAFYDTAVKTQEQYCINYIQKTDEIYGDAVAYLEGKGDCAILEQYYAQNKYVYLPFISQNQIDRYIY